jgi:hypothetical protein
VEASICRVDRSHSLPRIITQVNNNEINNNNNDEEDYNYSIIEVVIPQDPKVNPIVINDDTDNNEGEDEDDFFGANDDSENDTTDGSINQGVRRSERAGQGTTSKYKDDYEMLMDMWRDARGGPRRAIIKDGIICFLTQDLNDAEPMIKEEQEEFALGVALTTYRL